MAEPMESRTLLSILVDTFDDVVADDGLTSLREAITQAAATPGADAIDLPTGSYALSLGELGIDDADPVTIEPVSGTATIDAQGASRVFSIAAGSDLTLRGLVITGGMVSGVDLDDHAGYGGGISNFGTLTLDRCELRSNTAFIGGGLYNFGVATIDDARAAWTAGSSKLMRIAMIAITTRSSISVKARRDERSASMTPPRDFWIPKIFS
jgi:hypothetical protein